MSEVVSRKFLQIEFPIDEFEDYGVDVIEATPVNDHNSRRWKLGAECASEYITIWEHEVDYYIELLTEMKNYNWEENNND